MNDRIFVKRILALAGAVGMGFGLVLLLGLLVSPGAGQVLPNSLEGIAAPDTWNAATPLPEWLAGNGAAQCRRIRTAFI
jgi:hypothetical protein